MPIITPEPEINSNECPNSPHNVSPGPIQPLDEQQQQHKQGPFLTPNQCSPFEYSEESQLDISGGGTPEGDHTNQTSPASQMHSTQSTNHELDSLDSLHLPSDINGDLSFTLSYNYQSSTLFLNIGKVYNLEMSDKGRRKTEFYVKAYVLPDRWVVIVSIKAITATD